MNDYDKLYSLLQNKLNDYSTSLNKQPANLYQPMQYILSLGGKRLRPLLALIACDLFDRNAEEAIPAALAVELFHNFSLVHDDIMDRAPLRRGKETVHEKWNPNVAILSGDALLVRAYEEVLKFKPEHLGELLALFNTTAIEVCEGQQLDMDFETIENISISDYINMITLKTAVLLGCSLKMGAIVANAKKEDAQHLYEFGKQTGIAFQLKDDILDVYGKTEKFGKQVGGDIISNKKTFLLLTALKLANKKQKQELVHWLNTKDFKTTEKINAVKNIYDELDIRTISENESGNHYKNAITHLSAVTADPIKIGMLKRFTDQLMEREY